MRILAIALAAVLGMVSFAAAQDMKVGYVQVERLMQSFPEYEDASKTYEKELQSWQTQLQEYEQQITTMREEYEQRAMLFSPEKKREKEQELLTKQREATQFYQDVFGEGGRAEKRQAELLAPIYEKINRAIEILGERDNYAMILNAQGLLYAQETLDLTDPVLEILKAGVDVSSGPQR